MIAKQSIDVEAHCCEPFQLFYKYSIFWILGSIYNDY